MSTQVDHLLDVYFWPTLFLCLGIYLTTYFVRTSIEGVFPKVKTKLLWTEVCLPLGPIGMGLLFALIGKSFPWPSTVETYGVWVRLTYSGLCGIGSAWVYGRFRSTLKALAIKKLLAELAKDPEPTLTPADPSEEKFLDAKLATTTLSSKTDSLN